MTSTIHRKSMNIYYDCSCCHRTTLTNRSFDTIEKVKIIYTLFLLEDSFLNVVFDGARENVASAHHVPSTHIFCV